MTCKLRCSEVAISSSHIFPAGDFSTDKFHPWTFIQRQETLMILCIPSVCACLRACTWQMAAQFDVWMDARRCWQNAAGLLPASITPPLSVLVAPPSFCSVVLLPHFSPYCGEHSLPILCSLSSSPQFVFLLFSPPIIPSLRTTCLFISSAALAAHGFSLAVCPSSPHAVGYVNLRRALRL